MTPVIGIDPGTEKSAYLVWDGQAKEVIEFATLPNDELLVRLRRYPYLHPMCLEMIQNFGSPMSNAVLDTVVLTGRIIECWEFKGGKVVQKKRSTIKTVICRDSKAKDSWVRQALIDRIGPVGTKPNPGPLYGITDHAWQSLAAAVVGWDELYATATT